VKKYKEMYKNKHKNTRGDVWHAFENISIQFHLF